MKTLRIVVHKSEVTKIFVKSYQFFSHETAIVGEKKENIYSSSFLLTRRKRSLDNLCE